MVYFKNLGMTIVLSTISFFASNAVANPSLYIFVENTYVEALVPFSAKMINIYNAGSSPASATAKVSAENLPAGLSLSECNIAGLLPNDSHECAVTGTLPEGAWTVKAIVKDTPDSPYNYGSTSTFQVIALPKQPVDLSVNLDGLPAIGILGQPYNGVITIRNNGWHSTDASAFVYEQGLPSYLRLDPCSLKNLAAGASINCAVNFVTAAEQMPGIYQAGFYTIVDGERIIYNNKAFKQIVIGTTQDPDLSIKFNGFSRYFTGQESSAYITISNYGFAAASADATVALKNMPPGFTLEPCAVAGLAPQKSVSCNITGIAPEGSWDITATVTDSADVKLENNTEKSTQNFYVPHPDLMVSILIHPKIPMGKPYQGWVYVHNKGQFSASASARLELSGLPAGLSLGACSLARLAAGEELVCPITGIPTLLGSSVVTGLIVDSADSNASNNSDSRSVAVLPDAPDLSVNNLISRHGRPGEYFSSTITITNNGAAAASSAANISVTLPPTLSMEPCSIAGLSVEWSITCTISGTGTQGDWQVTVSANDSTDINISDNTATATYSFYDSPPAELQIDVSGLPYAYMGIAYSGVIIITNHGWRSTGASANVRIMDESHAFSLGVCPIANLAPKSSVRCTMSGVPASAGYVDVQVTAVDGAYYYQKSAYLYVGLPGPDLSVSVNFPSTGTVGMAYSGTITITNAGPSAASADHANVGIAYLPAGLKLGDCPVANLAVGGSITCTVTGTPRVANGATGGVLASVFDDHDVNTSNNTAWASLIIAPGILSGVFSYRAYSNGYGYGMPMDVSQDIDSAKIYIEPRQAETDGVHRIIFFFNQPVTSAEVTVSGMPGSIYPVATVGPLQFNTKSNTVIVPVIGARQGQRVRVVLNHINGVSNSSAEVSFAYLVGDVSRNGIVNSADTAAQSRRISQIVNVENVFYETDHNGVINSGDTALAGRFSSSVIEGPRP